MPSLNRITIMGNITKEPELRYLDSGMALCKIGLAVNEEWKNKAGEKQKKTVFFDVTFWDKRAETIAKFCHKGDPLYVEGKMESTTKETDNGEKRTYWGVKAEGFQFLATKNGGGGEHMKPAQNAGQDEARHPLADPDDF